MITNESLVDSSRGADVQTFLWKVYSIDSLETQSSQLWFFLKEYKNDDLAFVRYGGHNATTLYGLGTFVCIHPKQTVHSYNITSAIPQIRLVKLNTVYP